jgi:hypothetical protein
VELLLISLAIAGGALALDKLSPPDPDKVRRILKRAKLVAIDQAPDGAATVVRGRAALLDTELTAPLSGRACAYWLVVFHEVGTEAIELGRASKGTPFLLRSEAGTARVIPEQARIGVTPTVFSQTMPMELHHRPGLDHPDPVIALALRTCQQRPNHHTTILRAQEYAVVLGEQVTVRGWVTHEADPEGAGDVTGYRAALPMRPVISGSRRARLLIGS